MTDCELKKVVEETHVFAELTPGQKVRLVSALKDNGHTVGFLGDGGNDIPALNEANVGISVDTAVDAAKDAADVVLLQKDLEKLLREPPESAYTKELISDIQDMISGEVSSLLLGALEDTEVAIGVHSNELLIGDLEISVAKCAVCLCFLRVFFYTLKYLKVSCLCGIENQI